MVQKLVGVRAAHAVQDLGFHVELLQRSDFYDIDINNKDRTEN